MIFLASILLRSRRFSLLVCLACSFARAPFLCTLSCLLIPSGTTTVLFSGRPVGDSVYNESCFFFMCLSAPSFLGVTHFSKFRSYTEETFARFLVDFNVGLHLWWVLSSQALRLCRHQLPIFLKLSSSFHPCFLHRPASLVSLLLSSSSCSSLSFARNLFILILKKIWMKLSTCLINSKSSWVADVFTGYWVGKVLHHHVHWFSWPPIISFWPVSCCVIAKRCMLRQLQRDWKNPKVRLSKVLIHRSLMNCENHVFISGYT